jgi:hypothetical protein
MMYSYLYLIIYHWIIYIYFVSIAITTRMSNAQRGRERGRGRGGPAPQAQQNPPLGDKDEFMAALTEFQFSDAATQAIIGNDITLTRSLNRFNTQGHQKRYDYS